MLLYVYSIYDKKIEVYNTPFFFSDHISAARAFGRLQLDPQSMLYAYPDDYALYQIGEFDDQTGIVSPVTPPKYIQSYEIPNV
jgi:hypothetical protein